MLGHSPGGLDHEFDFAFLEQIDGFADQSEAVEINQKYHEALTDSALAQLDVCPSRQYIARNPQPARSRISGAALNSPNKRARLPAHPSK
ncbi:hypothetical protein [Bradyrhizobium sp. ARR65]|uniref:hypothetical protein n=1 Tax=Bradyrhizobium sp. ARR65 TaxID=1040989 RepID=UPI0012F93E43|nr:hypothetical protein [Bradyrhizobium sp. ARR65]